MSPSIEVAIAHLSAGRPEEAVHLVERGLLGAPDLAFLFVDLAVAHAESGAPALAIDAVRRAVSLDPDVQNGYPLWSNLLMPGENYIAVLRRLHEFLAPRNYLEIGIRTGKSLACARAPTVVVGVDPQPCLEQTPQTTCTIFPLGSDDFFATQDIAKVMGAKSIDFAFIDGLHVFEQALRDFINIERNAGSGTLVAIHDTLPVDALTAGRERATTFWTGDVWKLAICLREARPELMIATVMTPPSGLTLVGGLDPQSTRLSGDYEGIVDRYGKRELHPDFEARKQITNAIPNDWEHIRRWLATRVRVGIA